MVALSQMSPRKLYPGGKDKPI